MAGSNNNGLQISDLAAVGAAATTLITTVSALAVTGALQQMARDHGVVLLFAFALVLIASVVWAGLALTKPAAAATDPPATSAAEEWPHVMAHATVFQEIERLLPKKRAEALERIRGLVAADLSGRYVAELDEIDNRLAANPPHIAYASDRIRRFRTDFPALCTTELDDVVRLLETDPSAGVALFHVLRQAVPLLVRGELDEIERLLETESADSAKKALKRFERLRPASQPVPLSRSRRCLRFVASRRILQIGAIACFAIGLFIGLGGMISTQREQERPSVAAELDAKGEFLSGTATAHNLGTQGRMLTQIVGVIDRGKPSGLQQEVLWYAITGPDQNGTAIQTFNAAVDDAFQALAVSATTSGNPTCLQTSGKGFTPPQPFADLGAGIVQHDLPGCVVIYVGSKAPPAPAR